MLFQRITVGYGKKREVKADLGFWLWQAEKQSCPFAENGDDGVPGLGGRGPQFGHLNYDCHLDIQV